MNEQACGQFECGGGGGGGGGSGEALEGVFATMNEQVIPGLGLLSASSAAEDTEAVEEVRGKWCAFLSIHINGQCRTLAFPLFLAASSLIFMTSALRD